MQQGIILKTLFSFPQKTQNYQQKNSYSDGKVRIWKWKGGKEVDDPLTLRGHRSSVSTLTYSTHTTDNYAEGQLLSSGSNDGKIIIWDVVQQKGLFRLQGHKDQITHTHFLTKRFFFLFFLFLIFPLNLKSCKNNIGWVIKYYN